MAKARLEILQDLNLLRIYVFKLTRKESHRLNTLMLFRFVRRQPSPSSAKFLGRKTLGSDGAIRPVCKIVSMFVLFTSCKPAKEASEKRERARCPVRPQPDSISGRRLRRRRCRLPAALGRSDLRRNTAEKERKEGGSTVAACTSLAAAAARVPPKGRGTVTADRV